MSTAGLPATTCHPTVADAPCGASSAAAQSTGTAAARRKLQRFMSSRSVACRALRVVWRPYPTTTPPHADPSRLDLFPQDFPSSPAASHRLRRTTGSNRPPRSPEGASMVQRDGHISEAELAAFADGSDTSQPAAPAPAVHRPAA